MWVWVWFVIFVILIWPIAVKTNDTLFDGTDGLDWFVSILVGTCVAALWPIAFFPAASYLFWQFVNRKESNGTKSSKVRSE